MLRKSHKWKSPGVDKIPNFWLHTISSAHAKLASNLNVIMKEPNLTPKLLCHRATLFLAKNSETENPKNYRPITCLSTSYKLLTSVLTERAYMHMEENNICPNEQKECLRGSYGCKDQLFINKMILANAHAKHRHLSTAWMDYKKAFDSFPHSLILNSLEMFEVPPVLINFLRTSMIFGRRILLSAT